MRKAIERWTEMGRAAMARLKRRSWKWWAVVTTALFALEEAGRALLSDSTANALLWLGEGIWWLTQQPVGYAGLFLVGYLVVLLGVSWLETRPKPKPQEPDPSPLSPEEKEVVHRIRVLWNRYGEETSRSLSKLFFKAIGSLPSDAYWADLLKPKHAALESARQSMSKALLEENRKTPKEVIDQFNDFFGVYLQACAWLARIQHHEKMSLEDSEEKLFGWWKHQHCIFRDKLWDEHERKALRRKLKLRYRIFDQVVADFIRSAETKPCDKHKPTPSDADT